MPIVRWLKTRFGTHAVLIALVGCSASGQPISPLGPGSETPTWTQPETTLATQPTKNAETSSSPDKVRRTYVSEGPGGINTILIYPSGTSNPSPIGKITKGLSNPVGMSLDADGNLYVANIDGADITVYSKGQHKLIRTIGIDVQEPVSTVVGKDGTLYVSEYDPATVLEFAKGAESPTRILSIPGSAWGVALDADNNLYVSYEGSDNQGHVEKFAPKSKQGTDLGISVGRAVDLRVDKAGDIVLGDGSNEVVNVYAPGKTVPTRQISTPQDPYMLALDASEKHLYVTTAYQLYIYDYKTGAQTGTITNGLTEATGVALAPPAPL